MNDTPDTPPPAPKPRRRWVRTLIRVALLAHIAVTAFEAGAWWYAKTGRYVTTENAYVKAPVIAVSPNIDGRAVAVLVGDNQPVAEGAVLFRIDPAPYRVQLKMAEARRAAVLNELRATRAELGQISAQMAEVGPQVKFFAKEVARQQRLVNSLAGTEAKLDEMLMEQEMAEQRLRSLREKREVVLAKLGGTPDRPVETHPMVLEMEAEIERVRLDLAYTEITAPVSGIAISWSTTAGTLESPTSVTDGSGEARMRLTLETPGEAEVTANAVQATAPVVFRLRGALAGLSGLNATQAVELAFLVAELLKGGRVNENKVAVSA